MVILVVGGVFFFRMRQIMATMGPVELTYTHENHDGEGGSVVYMTTDISPEGMMAVYKPWSGRPPAEWPSSCSLGSHRPATTSAPSPSRTWCVRWTAPL